MWRLSYGIDGPGFDSMQGQDMFIFFSLTCKSYLWLIQAHVQRLHLGFLSSKIQRSVRRFDHTHPSIAEAEKEWS